MRAIDLLHTMLNPVIPRWLGLKKCTAGWIINNLNLKPDFTTGAFVRGVYSVYLPGRPVLELGLLY